MIDVRRLRVLRELAVHGTVTATARALSYTPSAVSQQLAALEQETGHRLLERAGRGVRLTDAGRVLVTHADAVLAEVERAESSLAAYSSGDVGTLRMAAFPTAARALAAPALGHLTREHPGLDVELLEMEQHESLHLLAAGDLDAVLGHHAAGEPRLGPRPVATVPLLEDPVHVALPRRHPRAADPAVDMADLREETWLAAHPDAPCSQILDATCRRAGFTPRRRHRAMDYDVVLAMVAAGLGLGLVSRLALGPVPAEVVLRPLAGGAARHVWLATRPGGEERPAVRHVLTALRAVVRDLPLGPAHPGGTP
ncbi:molybdate transport repressor ModE-like protein [Kineococcus xinjiangensis]|uniref:Molybdate transport repressor ModE-like protein n=1 Tax=Kineococcus xinjiangensis TaxID=512762 RepID=A0A2S6ISZ4_9ACTN|nr:LysR family transcriptional regulator [Kineococcus xinjiangensis]PPK97374.1 molybdate transport repressor ModE-like protein [Kineococcus xinjiangensis]